MLATQHSSSLPKSLGAATSLNQGHYGLEVELACSKASSLKWRALSPATKGHTATPEADAGPKQQVATKQHTQQQETGKGGEDESQVDQPVQDENESSAVETREFKAGFVWPNIIAFIILHSSLPLAIYLIYTQRPWMTLAFSVLAMYVSILGVTIGAHRLWSHQSYKAKWPVQVFLIALHTMAGQNSSFTWARDHRLHHKYCETNADPHNIKRGLFFAHMGWLCLKKHPEVREKGKQIDLSDLKTNPYVMFQHRNFWWLALIFTVLVPTMIPVVLWGESLWTSFVLCFMFRYIVSLHATWLVNSSAHYHGPRPYDTKTEARESMILFISGIGEGAHNYHHTFPHDYTTPEFGRYFNVTTAFIDLCASVGLVYGRRTVKPETIVRRRERTGNLAECKLKGS